jgi:hypothetical protein
LFSNSYADKEQLAKIFYMNITKNVPSAVEWGNLDPKVRDIAVDLTFQGLEGKDAMLAVSKNDAAGLSQYIRGMSNNFEPNRGRLKYLQSDP